MLIKNRSVSYDLCCLGSGFIDSHNIMISSVLLWFQDVLLPDFIGAVQSAHCELQGEIEVVDTVSDALEVVTNHLSLMNMFYLESVCSCLRLKDALSFIDQHKLFLKQFYELTLDKMDGLSLMPNYNQQLLISDQVYMMIDWAPAKATCEDLKALLQSLFNSFCCYVFPFEVVVAEFVIVKCFAPSHLHTVLRRAANNNKEETLPGDVLLISIGGYLVWERNKELEVSNYCLIIANAHA